MSEVALLLLQVSTSIAPSPSKTAEILLHPVPPATCARSSSEITVCARDPNAYRLPKTGPSLDQPALPQAEWRLFGATKMGVHMTERSLPQGASAPAAMVTIKIPF